MIICKKTGCPYLNGTSCDKQFVTIHESGLCDEWVWCRENRGPRSVIEDGEEPRISILKKILKEEEE